MIHNMIANTPMILNRHHQCSFLFVNELMIQEVHANTSTIHNIISINFQYTLGAHTVTIPQSIRMNAIQAINHTGHFLPSAGAV